MVQVVAMPPRAPAPRSTLRALLALQLLHVLCPRGARAYDNGYGLKPFLGWQSWCAVGAF